MNVEDLKDEVHVEYDIQLGNNKARLIYCPKFDGPNMIFVDDLYKKWKRGIWCHLWSPNTEHLHQFAQVIGLKRKWFQNKPHFGHYDVTKTRRALAVSYGVAEITIYDMVKLKNYWKNERSNKCNFKNKCLGW